MTGKSSVCPCYIIWLLCLHCFSAVKRESLICVVWTTSEERYTVKGMLTHSFHIFCAIKFQDENQGRIQDDWLYFIFKDGSAITKSSYVITGKFSQFAAAPLTDFLFVPFFHVGGKIQPGSLVIAKVFLSIINKSQRASYYSYIEKDVKEIIKCPRGRSPAVPEHISCNSETGDQLVLPQILTTSQHKSIFVHPLWAGGR